MPVSNLQLNRIHSAPYNGQIGSVHVEVLLKTKPGLSFHKDTWETASSVSWKMSTWFEETVVCLQPNDSFTLAAVTKNPPQNDLAEAQPERSLRVTAGHIWAKYNEVIWIPD